MRAAGFIQGTRCGTCSPGGFKSDLPAWVYVVASESLLKLGITNNPGRRLLKHRDQGLTEVLHLVEFGDGTEAQSLERVWKQFVKEQHESMRVPQSLLPDGYTEALRRVAVAEDFVSFLVLQ